jgi:hypothetical protein
MNASRLCLGLTVLLFSITMAFAAEPPPIITGIERQPLTAQVRRLLSATEYLGSPLPATDRAAIDAAINETDAVVAVRKLQQVLDKHVLYVVQVRPNRSWWSKAGGSSW